MDISKIGGGICAPKGYMASGIHCGFRKNRDKKDLGIIISDKECSVAAVFTQNKVKGAPIAVDEEHIKDGKIRAVICNSGNANTCAVNGIEVAENTCRLLAEVLDIKKEDVFVSSTGVIGEPLKFETFEEGVPRAVKELSYTGSDDFAHAIMTTDTVKKEVAYSFKIAGKEVKIGGVAKGSGMIHPNMATMLCFITTDADITPEMLQKALNRDIKDSFNQISVDGDTSTNDTVCLMANGMAENILIDTEDENYRTFCDALATLTKQLAKGVVKDGEGATKMIECTVTKAPDKQIARRISKAVITSTLFKSAIFGEDANWGRILCAVGYSGADFDINFVDVYLRSKIGSILVCKDGSYYEFDEDMAAEILTDDEIFVDIDLNQGLYDAKAWGCDLSYEYVRINGDYRT